MRENSRLYTLLPGLDVTRLFISLTAGAGTRCMEPSLFISNPVFHSFCNSFYNSFFGCRSILRSPRFQHLFLGIIILKRIRKRCQMKNAKKHLERELRNDQRADHSGENPLENKEIIRRRRRIKISFQHLQRQ